MELRSDPYGRSALTGFLAAEGAKAANTIRAYRADWEAFGQWADRKGLQTLPATPPTLRLYVSELAQTAKASTIARRLSAIAHVHRRAGRPSPTDDEGLRALIAALRHGHEASTSAPIELPLLARLVDRLPSGLSGIRDRAVLLVGHATAFRRSELVAINLEEVTETGQGLLVTRPNSANDEKAPPPVEIRFGPRPALCPVEAVHAWCEHARLAGGPLFRPVDRHGRVGLGRLSAVGISRVVQRAVARAGLDPRQYSAESLRIGAPGGVSSAADGTGNPGGAGVARSD